MGKQGKNALGMLAVLGIFAMVGVAIYWVSTQAETGVSSDTITETNEASQSVKPASIKVTAFDYASNTVPQTAPSVYAWKSTSPEVLVSNAGSLSMTGSTSISGWQVNDEANLVAFNNTFYGDIMTFKIDGQTPVANIKVYREADGIDRVMWDKNNARVDSQSNTTFFALSGSETHRIKLNLRANQTERAFDLKGLCFDVTVGTNITEISPDSGSSWSVASSPRRLNVNSQCEYYLVRSAVNRLWEDNQEEDVYFTLKADSDGVSPPETVTMRLLDEGMFKSIQTPNKILVGVEDDSSGTPSDVGASDQVLTLVVH